MLKTMVMTTGEFEFDTIFFSTELDFAAVSYVLWIVFVILMPVLLTNLLVRGWGWDVYTKFETCSMGIFKYLVNMNANWFKMPY